jgi:hypothetical protein
MKVRGREVLRVVRGVSMLPVGKVPVTDLRELWGPENYFAFT